MKDNWQTKKLCEVCEISAGNSAPQKREYFVNGKYPFFRTSDIGRIHLGNTDKPADFLNEDGVKGMRLFREGTLLFPKSGASTFLNHRVIMAVNGYVSSHLATIRANSHILDERFLYYFSTCIDSRSLMQDQNYPSLRLSDIGNISILLPPLDEQQRIVGILDEVFAGIEKAKENTEKNLQNARELFESYLQNIFANPGEDWEENSLGSLTLKIGSGATPRGGKTSYKTEGISLVRSMNVHDREFKEKNLAFIDNKQATDLSNVTLEKGDVLLNITGASVARGCVFPEKYLPARVNQHVSIIRPKQNVINPVFLNYLLTSKYYKDQLLGIGEQGATRQAITKAQLEDFIISFPVLLSEQKAVVEKLDALSAETRKLDENYKKKLVLLEELKQSVLQSAFAGEL